MASIPLNPSSIVGKLGFEFSKKPGTLTPAALIQEAEGSLASIAPSFAPILRLLDACGVAPDELHGELVSAGADQLRGVLGPVTTCSFWCSMPCLTIAVVV